jgi:uncharacterized protein (TIGR00661 family)
MNIVYGVSGEGLGHVFEAIEIVTRLRREGHSVKVLTYGDRACTSLKAFNPTRIEGVHLYFNPDGMSLVETVFKNWRIIPFYLRNLWRLRRELRDFRPDVFITAYEPFSMIASHVMGKPLISMDNQNELLHINPPAGTDMFAFRLARLATRVCTHGAAVYIVKSLNKQNSASEKVRFVSPIIQDEIRRLEPTIGSHVLVYLTKPNPDLIEILKSMEGTFVVYCNNRVGKDGNISYRAQGATYLQDLSSCKAIVATTGFSLIADSIYLKKPYFGAPLRKQFEQTHNAHFLVESRFGEYSESITKAELEKFMTGLPAYRERLSTYNLDPAEQEETLLVILREIEIKSGKARPGSEALAANPQQQ